MIIEQISVNDKNTIVKIDTDNKIICLSENDIIPFAKISYLVLKIGKNIGVKDYMEFHAGKVLLFSVYITQKQVTELEKFFNIRTDLLERMYEIKKNRKYCLVVSEPWDFHNNITGTVLDVNEKRVIFKSDMKLEIQGVCGYILMLHSRDGNKCDQLPLRVNASIILSDYDSSKTDEQLSENSKFVIVGSLRKIQFKDVFEKLQRFFIILFLIAIVVKIFIWGLMKII